MTDSTTTIRKLLRKHRITDLQLAQAAQCDRLTVRDVLDPAKFSKCKPLYRREVRNKAIEMLTVMGWTGNPDALWAEYDATLTSEQEAA